MNISSCSQGTHDIFQYKARSFPDTESKRRNSWKVSRGIMSSPLPSKGSTGHPPNLILNHAALALAIWPWWLSRIWSMTEKCVTILLLVQKASAWAHNSKRGSGHRKRPFGYMWYSQGAWKSKHKLKSRWKNTCALGGFVVVVVLFFLFLLLKIWRVLRIVGLWRLVIL